MHSPPNAAVLVAIATGSAFALIISRRRRRPVRDDSFTRKSSPGARSRRSSRELPAVATVLGAAMVSMKMAKQPPVPVPLVLVSDPGQDLDDEMSYIMLRYLVKKGLVELRGIICTLAPAFDRARLCRGTLDLLGLHDCPVGIGTDGGDQEGLHTAKCFAESASSYMPAAASESCSTLTPGRGLLYRLYCEAEPKSLTLAIIASLKDAALFLRDHEALFVEKTNEVRRACEAGPRASPSPFPSPQPQPWPWPSPQPSAHA